MSSYPDNYTAHFGLRERPFSLVPDPTFMFWSAAHRRAFAILEYGVLTRAPITLITGEVGTGKTMLVQHLLSTIGGDIVVGLVSNATGGRGDLLRWVLASLDLPAGSEASHVELFARFQAHLVGEYATGRRVVLVIDEAQGLPGESLEELRMFTNINTNKDELLQLILVGQPELRDLVRRPEMTQFAQRVGAAFHLEPMDRPTVDSYIAHRLEVAGATRPIFDPEAMALIHRTSDGVARLVNQLCDLSLVYAFAAGVAEVSRHTVQMVLQEGVLFSAAAEPVLPPLRALRRRSMS